MILRQSTSKAVSFGPFLDKTNGVDLEVGLVSAIDHATTGILLSKNGGALTIRSQAVTASTYDAYGNYIVTLSTTDTNTVGTLRVQFSEAATCLPVWQDFQVVEEAVFDAFFAASGTGVPALGALEATSQSILTDTAVIGALGAGLTAIPWNAAWDAEVQSEVDDALVAQRLDELLNADSDIDGAAPPTVGSVFHELLTKTAGSFTYDQTTDSLEAVRDRGDAAWITATGFATPTNITAATGVVLSGVTHTGAVIPTVTTLTGHTAQTGDNFARLGAPAGASVSADIAAVKVDTAAILVDTGTTLDGRIPAALTAGGNMKSDALAINGSTTAAATSAILNGANVVYSGTVTGAATTTTLIDSGLTQADTDWWKGRIIVFTSVITLQATDITAFDPALDKLTFTATTQAPTGATYVII